MAVVAGESNKPTADKMPPGETDLFGSGGGSRRFSHSVTNADTISFLL
jgi:hypothetical protein